MHGGCVFFADEVTGESVLFEKPEAILVAREAGEFDDVIDAAARALAEGKWLAGYFAYETGFLFEEKLRPLLPAGRRAPLVCLGVFAEPASQRETARLHFCPAGPASIDAVEPAWSLADYRGRFERLRQHLRQGDCYQANLTFPMRARYSGEALSLLAALRARQPVTHAAFVDLEGPVILSRSPELFFKVTRDGVIESRPMKGTAPRGKKPEEDDRLRRFLETDPKNRSENVMIVDLLRNDLSHVCEAGSVQVPVLFRVESYATVHQMISHVRGRLSPGTGLRDIFAALFPCGSITGAPKMRAMELLHALEGTPRDVYCGAIGWAAPTGAMQFNVAIRTLSLYENGDAVFNVGGGVIFDSTAEAEYEECLLKSRFARLAMPVPA